jgi:hypothetical protein
VALVAYSKPIRLALKTAATLEDDRMIKNIVFVIGDVELTFQTDNCYNCPKIKFELK